MAAPTPPRSRSSRSPKDGIIARIRKKYVNYDVFKSLIFDPAYLSVVSVAIIFAELILNIFIIQNVRYTEIDWVAYMQECEGFLNGTTNYALLKGDTGPLVYPAGFVYIYSALYYITNGGQNIRLAQYIFAAVYLLQLCMVLRLYTKSRKVPPYVVVLSVFTSYRIHSIYVLRLFNDPVAILFLYIGLNFFMDQRWTLGSIFFSLGVCVKMNILLFAPAVLLLYITSLGYWKTFRQLCICATVQILLGLPFLATYPVEYIKGSFDLGRIFEHKWTVNYRFLSRSLFENTAFHLNLLLVHLALLALFFSPCYKFFQSYSRLRALQSQLQPQIDRENARVKQNKKIKKKEVLPATEKEEELTSEQKNFLKSFEKSLKKAAGGPPKPNANETVEGKTNEDTKQEVYSIYFNKAVQLALLPLFLCNFIGIVCARSLHYQFYIWYFHSLPYLVWSTNYSTSLRFLILALIELCWNTYPSTDLSSLMLHCCHLVLLVGVGRRIFKSKTDSEKVQ